MKTYYSSEPSALSYYPQRDGSAEAYLRRNITREKTEEGLIWTAEEIFIKTHLSEEEILSQFDSYFEKNIEITIEDLAEAIDILTGIILEDKNE